MAIILWGHGSVVHNEPWESQHGHMYTSFKGNVRRGWAGYMQRHITTQTPGRNRAQNAKAGSFSTTGRKGKHELVTKTPLHPASARV